MKKILIPSGILLLFLAIFISRFFIKIKVECRSQYGGCPKEVTDGMLPLNGKSISYAERTLKKELKSNFFISTFSIQFKLPNILRIDLLIKKPVFVLKNSNSGLLALIDADGGVLSYSNQTDLPIVITPEELPKVGEEVKNTDLLALKLMDGVYQMYQTGTGNIEVDTLLVDIPMGVRVIFPLVDADKDLLLGSLRLIYSNIRGGEENAPYSQIDLRYNNPVLR